MLSLVLCQKDKNIKFEEAKSNEEVEQKNLRPG